MRPDGIGCGTRNPTLRVLWLNYPVSIDALRRYPAERNMAVKPKSGINRIASQLSLSRALPWFAGLTASALGVLTLGARDLWLDEAFTVGAANQLPQSIIDRGGSMAIYYLFMGVWSDISIDAAFLRLPSVVCAGLAVGLSVRLAQRLYLGRVGLFSAMILVPSWGVLRYAQEARSYSLVMLLAVASVLTLVTIEETATDDDRTVLDQRGHWMVWGLLAALLTYSHPYATFIWVAQLASLLRRDVTLRDLAGRAWPGFVVLSVALVPMAYMVAFSTDPVPGWIPPLGLYTFHTTMEMLAGTAVWAQVVIALALVGATVVVARTAKSHWPDRLLLFGCYLPVSVLVAMSIASSSVVGRFLIGSLPATAILLAVAIDRTFAGGAGLIGAGAVMLVLLPGHIDQHGAPGEPWSEAIGLVEEGSADGQRHGVFFPDPWQRTPFIVNAQGRAVLDRTEPVHPAEPWSEILREYDPVGRDEIVRRSESLDAVWTIYRDVTPWFDGGASHSAVTKMMAELGWCPLESHELRDDVTVARYQRCVG